MNNEKDITNEVLDQERRGFLKRAISKVSKGVSLRRTSPKSSSELEQNIGVYSTPCISELQNEGDLQISNVTYNPSETDDASVLFSKPPAPQSNLMTIVVGVFVAVGGFLFGYDTGLINSIIDMNYVKENMADNPEGFTAKEMSIIVSFLSLGTFIGALSAPLISDSYGRKITIIFSTMFVFSIGNSLQVAAHSMELLIAGRVISGLGIGLISAVVPLYQGEAANKYLRGAIISTYQWAITWGLLVSSAVSQGTHSRNSASSYRIPIGLQYVWAFVLAIGMLFLPESPRYYVLKDQLDKAAQSLSFLRGVPITDAGLLEELVEIKATYDYEASFGTSTLLDCFRSSNRRPKQTLRMLSGIAIQACQQFSGINFIFYYGVNFFNRTGVTNSYLVSFITYAVNVAFNIPGLFLVEYIGRRYVLLYGGILMTTSNFIIAIVGCSTNSVVANKVMIAFICMFIASFSATWGGVVWVISAELYPLGVRSKCTAICAASNWLVNFVCALITPYIVDPGSHTSSIGPKIFFIWGSLNALGVVVVYFTIYETRGLTLEEIDELYSKSPNSMQSTKWNKRIRERTMNEFLDETPEGESHLEGSNSTVTNNQSQGSTAHDTTPHIFRYTSLPEGLGTANDLAVKKTINDNEQQHNTSSETEYDDLANAYVDLGNGLGINTYTRGPPSIASDSSGEIECAEGGSFSQRRTQGSTNMASVNEYMAHLMESRSESSNIRPTDSSANRQ
ncbi:hypothetical protein HG537_0B04830 [Torulaspora globosa]|uniref:Major facilitator superfamily (MFS) profile domain-containing protein n=1 Tax=Torulaspora globosa TaxID=48254 RepID=A0A7H9HRZ1_9SACH|nr:hypothetical protein HG537_0B04830 [Torulaspora sp. CBS 2947]